MSTERKARRAAAHRNGTDLDKAAVAEPAVQPPTVEQIRQALTVRERQESHAAMLKLMALAKELGVEIFAMPRFLDDGRISAVWGVKKV